MTAHAVALVDFALEALARTPEARMADVYKWLFQAVRGNEHAVSNAAHARGWLEREWESLTPPRRDEPLVEPLRPDGLIVRLHLRPCRAQGMAQSDVARAMLASAVRVTDHASMFGDVWQQLRVRLSERAHPSLDARRWHRLDATMRTAGYGPIHHSAVFRAAHQPAYRVLHVVDAEVLAGRR